MSSAVTIPRSGYLAVDTVSTPSLRTSSASGSGPTWRGHWPPTERKLIEPSDRRRGALMSPCPSPETLGRLADASLSASNFSAMEAHVEACPDCQGVLERLAADSSAREDREPKRLPLREQPPT